MQAQTSGSSQEKNMERDAFYQFQKQKKIKQYVVWVYKYIHSNNKDNHWNDK